ncbi:hypothetical protein VP01_2088g1, partial [Puccinia sorghi]
SYSVCCFKSSCSASTTNNIDGHKSQLSDIVPIFPMITLISMIIFDLPMFTRIFQNFQAAELEEAGMKRAHAWALVSLYKQFEHHLNSSYCKQG